MNLNPEVINKCQESNIKIRYTLLNPDTDKQIEVKKDYMNEDREKQVVNDVCTFRRIDRLSVSYGELLRASVSV